MLLLLLQSGAAAGDQTVSPSGIASTAAFGTPTLTTGEVTVSPSGISSTVAFGSPTVDAPTAGTVSPTGISGTVVFGSPTITTGSVTVSPTGIASTAAFGTPSVLIASDQTVSPDGIASTLEFGAPSLTAVTPRFDYEKTGGAMPSRGSGRWYKSEDDGVIELGRPYALIAKRPTITAPAFSTHPVLISFGPTTLLASSPAIKAPTFEYDETPTINRFLETLAQETWSATPETRVKGGKVEQLYTTASGIKQWRPMQKETWSATSETRWDGDEPEQLWLSSKGRKQWRPIRSSKAA
jgi:hypothetical protein